MSAPAHLPDGIHHGIAEADYHALDRFSKSAATKLLRSPAHYRYGERTETAAMKQGSLIDVALTEPDRLDTGGPDAGGYHVVADELRMDSRSKAYQAEQAQAGDRIIVRQRDMDAALAIRDAVQAHSICRELLDGAKAQTAALWTERLEPDVAVPCKSRLDWINKRLGCVIDLKSTDDARPGAFGKTAARFDYPLQAAVYLRGYAMAGGTPPEAFIFIVVERDPPHGIGVYDLPERALAVGVQRWHEAVERYAHCRATDHWPGYQEVLSTADLPVWFYPREEII